MLHSLLQETAIVDLLYHILISPFKRFIAFPRALTSTFYTIKICVLADAHQSQNSTIH